MFRLQMTGNVGFIHLEVEGSVAPHRWSELPSVLTLAEKKGASALVFTGAPGTDFFSTQDPGMQDERTAADILRNSGYVQCAMQCVAHGKLFAVAALHGMVTGPGLVLASACDVRVSTEDAQLGLPDIRAGVYGGYALLSKQMPLGVARRMALTGAPISGKRAYEIGFVQEMAKSDSILDVASGLAREMSETLSGRLKEGLRAVMNRQDEAGRWEAYQIERVFAAEARSGARQYL